MIFGEDFVTGKDGILFAHQESLYERNSLNTLFLHWRNPQTSEYLQLPTPSGLVEVVLKLSPTYESFITFEDEKLQILDADLIDKLSSLTTNKLYNLRVSVDLQIDESKFVIN